MKPLADHLKSSSSKPYERKDLDPKWDSVFWLFLTIYIHTITFIYFKMDLGLWGSLHDGEGRSHLCSTPAIAISVSKDIYEALHTPGRSPWIFDLIMFGPVHLSKANSQNPMVQISPTLPWKHPLPIKLEEQSSRIHSNRNRLLSYSSLQNSLVVDCDISTIIDGPHFIPRLVVSAFADFGCVRIFVLRCYSVIFYVEKWEVHQTSVTAVVSVWLGAVYQLLFWEI